MSAVLRGLQHRLEAIYGLDAGPDVCHYLIDASAREQHFDHECHRASDEMVLVRESDDGVDVGVYVAADVLARLADADPLAALDDERLNDLWLAIEGVSHFSFLVHRAHRAGTVSLLELELQAEIDKFVSTWWLACEQGYSGVRDGLWRRLFVDTGFDAELSREETERYTVASRYAGYFCADLALFDAGDHAEALRDLRHFYRLDQPAKFSEIHRQRLTG